MLAKNRTLWVLGVQEVQIQVAHHKLIQRAEHHGAGVPRHELEARRKDVHQDLQRRPWPLHQAQNEHFLVALAEPEQKRPLRGRLKHLHSGSTVDPTNDQLWALARPQVGKPSNGLHPNSHLRPPLLERIHRHQRCAE